MWHSPFPSVVQDPVVLTSPATVNWTTVSGTGWPEASATIAVTVWLVPTALVAAAGLSVTVAGGPTAGWLDTKSSPKEPLGRPELGPFATIPVVPRSVAVPVAVWMLAV